jgi:Fuc2NAc and GlcNAc transferase
MVSPLVRRSSGPLEARYCCSSAELGGVAALGLVLAPSCLGFLVWNWSPAKIFMGDIGSGYLGYLIAIIALAAVDESPDALWPWLILGGAFFVDATVTLVRRIVRGDRVYEAHQRHAYQWLARRWRSHKIVTVSMIAVNLLWLLPCACAAVLNPRLATWIAIGALSPLVVVAIAAGAGRRENT